MRNIRSYLLILLSAMIAFAGKIPSATGIVATDIDGKTWNFDALLKAGKHIVVHQAFSG